MGARKTRKPGSETGKTSSLATATILPGPRGPAKYDAGASNLPFKSTGEAYRIQYPAIRSPPLKHRSTERSYDARDLFGGCGNPRWHPSPPGGLGSMRSPPPPACVHDGGRFRADVRPASNCARVGLAKIGGLLRQSSCAKSATRSPVMAPISGPADIGEYTNTITLIGWRRRRAGFPVQSLWSRWSRAAAEK